jgi:signal transduction histidine kinase/CheY-like chemotaxis protein
MVLISRKSSSRYGLLVLLILTLFISAIFFYVRNNRIRVLSTNINQLQKLEYEYAKLDTCILLLFRADNNCHLYKATADKNYIKQFSADINRVTKILDSLKETDTLGGVTTNIKGLVSLKNRKTEIYLKLKDLTDSVFRLSSRIDTATEGAVFKVKELTNGNFKTMVLIDTIKAKEVREKEKKLFGRIADAITNKRKRAVDTNLTLVRKEVSLDTSFTSREYNKRQLRKISAHFENMYAAERFLRKSELEILNLNSKIIKEIVGLIQSVKEAESNFVSEAKLNIQQDIAYTFTSISNIYWLIFLCLFVIVVVILVNLWRVYRNETNLIDYGARVEQYAKSKSRFLANMSHEIRTPLNSVVGFSEQLSKDNLSEAQMQQVESIKTSSVLLLELVNDILDFSKYEGDKIKFDNTPFSIVDSINEVINSIAIQADKKGVKLIKDISFNANLCVNGDALRLKQVIMNLLSNAIKFTDNGSVTLKADLISSSKRKVMLKMQIIDTGVGIEEKDLALIFDEFAQVNYAATRSNQKGTGLGLAICKKIVELQNGKIGVKSTVNKGSTFTFEIPYEISNELVGEQKKHTVVNIEKLANKRTLLVDDNKLNVLLAQTVLKKYSILTDVAYNGKEAFDLFEKNDYDLILTDVQMPIMGGVELTRLIRNYADPEKAKVPVLGVTANIMEDDRKRYLATGINDLVLKPYSESELIEKMSQFV